MGNVGLYAAFCVFIRVILNLIEFDLSENSYVLLICIICTIGNVISK